VPPRTSPSSIGVTSRSPAEADEATAAPSGPNAWAGSSEPSEAIAASRSPPVATTSASVWARATSWSSSCSSSESPSRRRPDASPAEPAADLDAVESREHHVEDDRVVVGRQRHPERLVARRGDVDRVALLGEAAPEETRHLQLVLDHEDAHPRSSSRWR
jgi:hypothetical protein